MLRLFQTVVPPRPVGPGGVSRARRSFSRGLRLRFLCVGLHCLIVGLTTTGSMTLYPPQQVQFQATSGSASEASEDASRKQSGHKSAKPNRSEYLFPSCQNSSGQSVAGPIQSYYVPMRDGVRIAVDVVLPKGISSIQRYPTILLMTRYWRRTEGTGLTDQEKFFVGNGYAFVTGDVRGTGASFGTWPYHRSRAETLDFGEIIDWISRQSWSDGQVVGYGLSYSANTADWMAERARPALKAIIPRFPDYDPYADLYFPGGIPNVWMGKSWGLAVKDMDLNRKYDRDAKLLPGVRPVDSDSDKLLLMSAIRDHLDVPSVWEGLEQITYRNDRPSTWSGASMDDWGIYSVRDRVEESGTPIQTWGSWLDAGTADGVLHRFMTQSNPQRAFVGAWPHGGFAGASPYGSRENLADPPFPQQQAEDLCFLDRYAKPSGVFPLQPSKLLIYFTMGEERWKTTTKWPPPEAREESWYFATAGVLEQRKPRGEDGNDKYLVDFTASTGKTNRWHTNGGVRDVQYGDRAQEDRKLLTYTSRPLPRDTEITGQPIINLFVASDQTDGAFFVYLEDVNPDGTVLYVTEGQLRGIDRSSRTSSDLYRVIGPYHSFRREDAKSMVPGETTEISFSLMPVSVLIRAGHRIRIALAGADADTFKRIPEAGDLTYTIRRDRLYPSHVVLPTIKR